LATYKRSYLARHKGQAMEARRHSRLPWFCASRLLPMQESPRVAKRRKGSAKKRLPQGFCEYNDSKPGLFSFISSVQVTKPIIKRVFGPENHSNKLWLQS